jgi:hypothetical protein
VKEKKKMAKMKDGILLIRSEAFSSDATCDPAHFYEYRYCNKKLFLPIYIFWLFERKRSTAATCSQ